MNKILCLYYSGVGNTKIVAEFMREYLRVHKNIETDIYSIEDLPENLLYEEYAGMIIGFPTIHCSPAVRIVEYISSISAISRPIPTFIFTTCGLYQANTTRIFAKMCRKKNMITVMDASYRMSAVDGMLLTNKMRFLETYEKRLKAKIEKACDTFVAIIETGRIREKIPFFRWYSVLNYPNKLVGQHYTFPIYLNKEKCIKCGKCVNHCPADAITREAEYPIWNKSACERCYRCLHHCPVGALSLKRKKGPSRRWTAFQIK